MITRTQGLDAGQLADARALAAEVVAHDGGRLKLELGYVERERVDVALAHDRSRLVGYLGLYSFGGSEAEIAGMVAPGHRRQGIGTSLLEALAPKGPTALLVVPSGTPAGRAFAESRHATRAHSEHFLVLGETPELPSDQQTVLRLATESDLPRVGRVLAAAFDEPEREQTLDKHGDTTYVIERAGTLIGTVRLSVADGWGGIYGFAIDPAYQGKGIGRDVLARACRLLREDGRSRVTVEVETENDNALHLYTSSGFVREAGEDYWRVEL